MWFSRNKRQVWEESQQGTNHLAAYPSSDYVAGPSLSPASDPDYFFPPQRPADRLFAELQASWSLVAQLLDALNDSSSFLRGAPRPSGSLRDVRDQYEYETRLLLVDPAEEVLYSRPIQRSIEAMQRCDQELVRASRSRSRIDRRFLRTITLATQDLCEPWRIYRRGGSEDEWRQWDERCARHQRNASLLLQRYVNWNRKAKEDSKLPDYPKVIERVERRYAPWWRQESAVRALLEMELAFRDLGLTWFSSAATFVGQAQDERSEILSEASQTLDWVQNGLDTGAKAPEQAMDLASPEDLLHNWTNAIDVEAESRLPVHAELGVPGTYPRWRSVQVRDAFLRTFTTYAQPPARHIVEEYWGQSAEVVREVARAREIVDYWREAPTGSAEGHLTDARDNAAAMLARQTEMPLATEDLEAKLANVFWAWNEESASHIEGKQFGWANLLRRPRGRRFVQAIALRTGQQRAQGLAHRSGRWISDRIDRILEYVGGKVPAHPTAPPVVRRTTLRDTLSLPASRVVELPPIYRLLFRLAPVEDRRFLVGRDEELAGLTQAVTDWDAGRFAAVLVVGARGSGKTSLLNCASNEAFSGHKIIRGQFEERALNRKGIDAFVRDLLHLEPGANLQEAFATERRILVIEEGERIFLRKVGGFAGADYLVALIHRTAPTTLWIIVMNDKALRVLDAGAHMHQAFSHRINAMSLSRDDLEKAILERHRLSGLHLEFAPPPAEDPRVSRVKRLLGLEDSAQKLFFDSLYQQSEGVLRSAFELWLSSIEQVEGQSLKIRQPLDPAFRAFRSELAQGDQFTLLAIQEHGSLTQRELSEILCESIATSRRRLDHLSALGLVEPDPDHPGLRVRPEAQRFTNDLLRRANLT